MDNRSTMANLEAQAGEPTLDNGDHGNNQGLQILSLHAKYKQSQELQDLEAAVETAHKAVEVATHSSDVAYFLDLLGELMLERFRRTGSDDDLEASVKFATQALGSIPEGDPMWPGIANNLALKLRQRSHKTLSTEDLEKGIQLCKRALSLPTQYVRFRQVFYPHLVFYSLYYFEDEVIWMTCKRRFKSPERLLLWLTRERITKRLSTTT